MDPNARSRPFPPAAPSKASFVPYLLAHLVVAVVLFVVVTLAYPSQNPITYRDVLEYLALHMPVPLLLSALLSWFLTRRMAPRFWALLLIALPTYLGVLFVFQMGLLMASTQQ